ncbi:MAG: glycosyltransferase [Alphaproteobacteria bacterium]|nr:MAG: glycosyltransferase [Alphaproteobacteria bacterium]
MRSRRHVIIMARAPRLGAVKRRLAHDIGAVAAWRFYRTTLGAVAARLAGDPRWTTWLALTPDRTAHRRPRLPRLTSQRCLRVVAQGRGDLGARMARLVRTLPGGPVVIVGSDIPDLGAAEVAQAFRALAMHDWVLGPAGDGGYWLIGAARRRGLPRGFLQGIRWSSRHALADTRRNLRGARIACLGRMVDIDTGADLARWRRCAGRPGSSFSRRRRGVP